MNPSASEIREYLHYDQETGWFHWIKSSAEVRCTAGNRAGSPHKSGYRFIKFKGRRYREHILAGLYMTGHRLARYDHRDRDRANNAWNNIRPATRSQNAANSKPRSRSGFKGVYRQGSKWRAQIRVNRRIKHLGYFTSAKHAHAAYRAAASVAFGEFARFG